MPGSFSGNGSVEWIVEVDNPKGVPLSKPDPKDGKSKRYHQSGVDAWGDAAYEFTIAIKIPKDSGRPNAKRDFAGALRAAASAVDDAEPNSDVTVSITLPVEDKDHGGPTRDQILISWNAATAMV